MAVIISLVSVLMIYAMGCKWKYAPVLGIFNQVLWIIYILRTMQYGLIPGVVGYLLIHILNTYKWILKEDNNVQNHRQ